jgi:hypothetical protein
MADEGITTMSEPIERRIAQMDATQKSLDDCRAEVIERLSALAREISEFRAEFRADGGKLLDEVREVRIKVHHIASRLDRIPPDPAL